MFLIEAEGKRIWHTGDYRAHGYMGKGLYPTLKKYATHIDTLITEGTMLNRQDECIHESMVTNKMANVMHTFKYIFVLASATDIERLASIKNASIEAKKPMYVLSKFLVSTMKLFTKHESESSHGLFSFTPRLFKLEYLNRLRNRGFVLVTGTSQISRIAELLKELPADETLLVYSTWDGYYKIPEQVLASPKHKLFRELFSNVVDIHTSGHADITTIKKVIEIVKPKEIICIHKEANAELRF
jgi:ribonuclease J